MKMGFLLAGLCMAVMPCRAAETGVPYGNAQRTGYVDVALAPPYHAAWLHRATHRPRPAWREPAWEPQRIDFDYSYAVSAKDDTVYYASSSDHSLHALDMATGQERWRFRTEGPVRAAAEFHGGNVLFGSDDGYVYCLNGESGELVWKFRPGTPDRRLIGNEQMISRWPARSGVLVDGDLVYTAFGMLSPEGVVVCCLDARTGEPLWVNDTCGFHLMARPHNVGMGGVSPQGYMALSDDVLVVVCGRSTPALFERKTGRLLYHEAEGDFAGGEWTMTLGDTFFMSHESLRKEYGSQLRRNHDGPEADVFELASVTVADLHSGQEVFTVKGGRRGILSPDGLLTLQGPGRIVATRMDDVRAAIPAERSNISHYSGHYVHADKDHLWAADTGTAYLLLQARGTIVAGGDGVVTAVDAANGSVLWKADIEGQARAMCIVPDALIVSTTEGVIYRFVPGDGPHEPNVVTPAVQPVENMQRAAGKVEAALAAAGVRDGYCLVAGPIDEVFLACLADRSDLYICHPSNATAAEPTRNALDAAGIYGERVVVHDVQGATLPYTEYFADVIIVDAPNDDALKPMRASELRRILRPFGGVAVVLCPDSRKRQVVDWLTAGGTPTSEIQSVDCGVKIVRGALPGAGEWTHQYADPGKTAASAEGNVRLPLKALWFGGLGPESIVSRHFREPAPLVIDGRCFVTGTDKLTAMNIYNGRILWQREFPDLAHWPAAYRGPAVVVDRDTVYVLRGRKCLRLDPSSGETVGEYNAPADALPDAPEDAGLTWEYLAVTHDAIIGTLGVPNVKEEWWSKAYPVNRLLFALEKGTGEARWAWQPGEAVDSNAIAIQGDRVFVIDGRPRYKFLLRPTVSGEDAVIPARKLLAIGLDSGEVTWETEDVPATLNSVYADGDIVLVAVNPYSRGMEDPVVAREGQGVAAYSAMDGKMLWKLEKVKSFTPVIMDGVVYMPEAYDMATGEPVAGRGGSRQLSVAMAKTCSALSGCPAFVMARAGSMGFQDLTHQAGLYHYPIARASCWINMIPAGGVVVVPEGSSSCMCAYNYKTSLALVSDDRQFHYGLGGGPGSGRSVHVNFGAPGDRPDEAGEAWRCWPRPVAMGRPMGSSKYGPKGRGDAPVDAVGGEPDAWGRNPDWLGIAGTDRPWIYSCGISGATKLAVELPRTDGPASQWRVTLHFCEPRLPASSRKFSVVLQGKTVIEDFDIAREAGGPLKALDRAFTTDADKTLAVELVQGPGNAPPPLLCGITVEKTLP